MSRPTTPSSLTIEVMRWCRCRRARPAAPLSRGTEIAIRLRGLAELVCLHDGTWPRPEHRMVFDLEHEALRLCDRILYPGESVLETYRTCTEGIDFAAAERVRLSFEPGPEPAADGGREEGPLRILFAGRLQQVKGVLPLVEACFAAEDPDWRLTLVGGDTGTGPMDLSMRAVVELLVGEDERVEIRGPLPHEELQLLYGEHDLVAVPVLLRGMEQRRPGGDAGGGAGARRPGGGPGRDRRRRRQRLARRGDRARSDPPHARAACWGIAPRSSGCAPRGRLAPASSS